MGSEIEEPQSSTTETSLTDYIYSLFEYALSIGMPSNEFWNESVDYILHYHQAEQIRLKKENTKLWLNGLYVYQAIGDLAPMLNGLAKDHKPKPYLKAPIPLTEEEQIEQNNEKVQRFANYLKSISKGGKK